MRFLSRQQFDWRADSNTVTTILRQHFQQRHQNLNSLPSCCDIGSTFFALISSLSLSLSEQKILSRLEIFVEIWDMAIAVHLLCPVYKVIYPKYSKHWPYTVAYTIHCVCSKMLNYGLIMFFFFHFSSLYPDSYIEFYVC